MTYTTTHRGSAVLPATVGEPVPWTRSGDEYRALRQSVGSQAAVARMLNVTISTISRRERGLQAVTREAWLALEALRASG